MTHEFVQLRHVTVVRGGRPVLHDLTLNIAAGEQIALLGPNGCGKSTLLKVLTCELYPLAEPHTSVRILGRERWDLTELRRNLGVVQADLPGQPMLGISGLDAVTTGFFSSSTLWPHLGVTGEQRDRAEHTLLRVGGGPLRGRLFGEMSAGQQRRVLIARALVASAGCLLLDEPSNALDLYAQRELRDLMVQLAADGTTMLLITHHLSDIVPAMQRVLLMQDGRILADGPREQLLTEQRLSQLFATELNISDRDGFLHAW